MIFDSEVICFISAFLNKNVEIIELNINDRRVDFSKNNISLIIFLTKISYTKNPISRSTTKIVANTFTNLSNTNKVSDDNRVYNNTFENKLSNTLSTYVIIITTFDSTKKSEVINNTTKISNIFNINVNIDELIQHHYLINDLKFR